MMMRIAVLLFGAAALACGTVAPSAPTPNTMASLSGELAFCAEQINAHRNSIGLPVLARSGALEQFAAAAAALDGQEHVAHRHFNLTLGAGASAAETEILWWSGLPIRSVIQRGLAQMWGQGPSGEHYDVLSGPYTQVGCGIFVNGAEVTVAQDFR